MDKKKWLIGIISSVILIPIIVVVAWNIEANDTNAKAAEKVNEERTEHNKAKTDVENTNDDKEDKESKDVTEAKGSKDDSKSDDKEENKDKLDKQDKKNERTKESGTVKEEDKVEKKAETKKTETKTESKPQANKSSSPSSSSNNKPKDTVTTKTTTVTESISFKTVRQNDSSLEKGKEVVAQNGQNGVKTITYKETYTNGKLTSKDQVSSKVTKNPVDKIVKVGTKAPQPAKPTYQSAAQAHSILAGSGMSKAGNTYSLTLGIGTDVMVTVGGSHVTNIIFNADDYIPWKYATLEDVTSAWGKEEGKKNYDWGKQQAAKIEKAVRAAANAVYGSGTSQANSLYNQIINSEGFAKSF